MERCGVDPNNVASASSAESEEAEQKRAEVDTAGGTEAIDATMLKERLAQVEEELRRAQARIAELERQ